MGLETVHPETLEKLNKQMTLDQFARSAEFLTGNGLRLRAFILVQPPFLPEEHALEWVARSVTFAYDCGVGIVALIPTRPGNGALEALQAQGEYLPPRLSTLERALEIALEFRRGRAVADTWDLQVFSECSHCFAARAERLAQMNLQQVVLRPVECPFCDSGRPRPAGVRI
jgi:uncharacterized Fe-S cluster-containing MiaB family protein